ncbi:MmyB family transcriptional regulator [Streptomyces tricolor]|uniref:Helix-turn-helix transcriptional regulator n=1 Tax=Streptomyces tricolor TaxID=68277 RepID=A0ABS9JJ51_9ACTN|nr:helix-turn-helix transcriptional regulator [Streptomyces tricolor]MCG0065587.1 helix-turn-helix transcriptional regulator [Streptomyces tricolor]
MTTTATITARTTTAAASLAATVNATATVTAEPVGVLLRRWRERRRRSQLDVSLAAELSTRHLSCIETGRANPSREMIRRLCDELEVPLRDRNALYLAAGYAPVHTERALADLGAAHEAVRAVLAGHEPHPALAVNVRWELMAANRAARLFLGDAAGGADRSFNVLKATLHPDGLAGRIRNLAQWRAHVLRRVRRQLVRTAAEGLAELLAELESYPAPTEDPSGPPVHGPADDLVVPLRLASPYGELALLYTTTVFGSPRDVTLDEIAIETFFPADSHTAELMRAATDAAG